MSSDAISFECPGCKRPCRVSGTQKAVQHSDPVCKLWIEHRGDRTGKRMQDFLGLALMAKGSATGELARLGKQPNDTPTPTERAAFERLYAEQQAEQASAARVFSKREKDDAIEQLNEGLKKL